MICSYQSTFCLIYTSPIAFLCQRNASRKPVEINTQYYTSFLYCSEILIVLIRHQAVRLGLRFSPEKSKLRPAFSALKWFLGNQYAAFSSYQNSHKQASFQRSRYPQLY